MLWPVADSQELSDKHQNKAIICCRWKQTNKQNLLIVFKSQRSDEDSLQVSPFGNLEVVSFKYKK